MDRTYGRLTDTQRKMLVKAIESDSGIYDFEGLPKRVQLAIAAVKDFETLEHDSNRLISDFVMHRNSQKSFW